MSDDDLTWRLIDAEPPSDYQVFRVRRHRAAHPRTGEAHTFSVIRSVPFINVLALTPEDHVVLVRQFRHGVQRVCVELPGGLVDPGEDPLEAARRELREETGFEAAHWERLGVVDANPAIQDNQCTLFLALDARRVTTQDLDPGEVIRVETTPLADIPARIAAGDITHTLVTTAFFFLLDRAGGWRRP